MKYIYTACIPDQPAAVATDTWPYVGFGSMYEFALGRTPVLRHRANALNADATTFVAQRSSRGSGGSR